MPICSDYQHFNGRHWETGAVANHWAYRGVTAPHSGAPYSEALLLGVSGGVVMGYFTFTYEGYDPHARILTRNTFDPLDTLLSRLGVVQHIQQTASAQAGLHNLLAALEDGIPPLVWADLFSLPYNQSPQDEGMWAMFPILVYGYDEAADMVYVADRARAPLTLTTAELAAARARVKKVKFRLLNLDPPDESKLATAVRSGIWDTIKLFTEKPPKGAKHNFGFAAFQFWADRLTAAKGRGSWAKEFAPGRDMFAGLTSAFTDINTFGKAGFAERDVYADFLEEAAVILNKPALNEAAAQFRQSAAAWEALSAALLPDDAPHLAETRRLLLQDHDLFMNLGQASVAERKEINGRLAAIKELVSTEFPLSPAEAAALRANAARHILAIHDIEREAINTLQAAL